MKVVKFSLFLFVCLFSVNVTAQETVRLANGEWEPYLGKKLKHYGVASHIVTEAFKEIGIKVEFKWYGDSWKRAYRDAKIGKVDGTLVWSVTPEREKEMHYSGVVLPGKRTVFFYLKAKHFDWNQSNDLIG